MRPSLCLFHSVASSTSRSRSVSFIGLGRMGSEMAYNLFSRTLVESSGSAHLVVCDARQDVAEQFVANFISHFPGARLSVASSPRKALLASQTVVTMLPSSPHVSSVYAQAEGIIPALRSLPPQEAQSTLCIDSTTLDVEVAREVAAVVHDTGATMVDAPVSGGVTGAKAATLSFLVGGTHAAFERASPMLKNMGKNLIYCGSSGAGLTAKICNNLVLGIQQIAVAEAMLLGQKLGLEASVLASVINSSTGACWASSVNNPVPGAVLDKSPPCERDYDGGFAMSLMLKDMRLAEDLADAKGSPLPLGVEATQVYENAIEDDPALNNKDFSSVYRHLRSTARY